MSAFHRDRVLAPAALAGFRYVVKNALRAFFTTYPKSFARQSRASPQRESAKTLRIRHTLSRMGAEKIFRFFLLPFQKSWSNPLWAGWDGVQHENMAERIFRKVSSSHLSLCNASLVKSLRCDMI